jgi:hypothetical protein
MLYVVIATPNLALDALATLGKEVQGPSHRAASVGKRQGSAEETPMADIHRNDEERA